MPKSTDRERLAELEEKHRKLREDVERTRREVRSKAAKAIETLPLEQVDERELKEAVALVLRVGGAASIALLKASQGVGVPSYSDAQAGFDDVDPVDDLGEQSAVSARPIRANGVISADAAA